MVHSVDYTLVHTCKEKKKLTLLVWKNTAIKTHTVHDPTKDRRKKEKQKKGRKIDSKKKRNYRSNLELFETSNPEMDRGLGCW